ncbi:Proteasome accessory factor C [Actinomyces bovis]|uniref:Proteasome accessory factor C n=1 Tax=Actinomyces bovis TaxID=1658 RepID=A0ABY1VPG6_9ACTO|nr:WYL domain-containing protein [Actinomyces bovis]SPT54018.1 Proteasome accessory factor C [Actinomyces bovis]VEG53846.1 Proteasome accessory factor C [Actinomyces israelii]
MARPAGSERLVRLMALPAWVSAHPGVSLQEAARHFNVEAEQLRQDILTLWMTGLPGMAGGDLVDFDYDALEEDGELYLTQGLGLDAPVRLSRHEAASLLLALRVLQGVFANDHNTAAALAQTQVVIQAALEGHASPSSQATAAQPSAAASSHPKATLQQAASNVIERVRQALREHRLLHLEYVSANDVHTSRDVEPLNLSGDGSHLTLKAWCHHAQAERDFRLDRVLSAQLLEGTVTHRLVNRRRKAAADQRPRMELTLAPTGRWLVEEIPCESATELEDGRWRVVVRGRDEYWLTRLVLSAGRHVLAVEPAALRQRAAAAAQAGLAAYPA